MDLQRTPTAPAEPPSFGRLLRQYRLAAGLTQEGLAERSNTSLRGVSDLERGARKRPQRATLRRLAEALGLHATEWSALIEASGRADLSDAVPSAAARLPAPLSSFVGREREIAELVASIRSVRLLTLSGPGGAGKTRLSIEVARRVAPDYRDGALWIELAGLFDADLLPQVVARSLGVGVGPGQQPLEVLRGALAARNMLLVVDNCEHLLPDCSWILQQLLEACTSVHVLATSREALGIAGETCWVVPPLSLWGEADDRTDPTLKGAESEASALFVARARAANRSLRLDARVSAAIADICRRLDGLPLAIELAAAWASVLPVQEIAARLAGGDGLLESPRGALPRHQTLGATVDWSLQLLSHDEVKLFEKLCAFSGGFTLAAADAVVGEEVLAPLARLVTASLITVEPDDAGRARYRILEPLREVGQTRLLVTGHAEQAHRQHAEYFQTLAESVQHRFWGRHVRDGAIPEIEADVDNLRSALRWLIDHGQNEGAARFGAALARFWVFSGRVPEGRAWLDELLSLDGIAPPTRARLLVGAAALATYDHEVVAAGPLVDAAFAAARESADDLALAWALLLRELRWLGLSDPVAHEQILTACAEGIDRSRAAGDTALESAHLNVRAVVLALDGRCTEGETMARFAMRVAAENGVPREVAFARLVVAVARYGSGDLEAADELFAEAHRAWRQEGEHSFELMAVTGRVLIAADRGNANGLRTHLTLLFELWADSGRDPRQAERILQAYAYAAGALGQHRQVVSTGAVLAAHGQSIDYLRRFGRGFATVLQTARSALGTEASASAWADGQAMSLEDARALAMADFSSLHRWRVEATQSGPRPSARDIRDE